jgi:DNA polymerase-3 subunit epsilon
MKIEIDKNGKRDKCGFYSHPQRPEWCESVTKIEIDKWKIENGVEIFCDSFEDSANDKMQNEWFYDGVYDCSEWKPECNKPGAILLSIHDTEDGPIAIYATPFKTILFYDTETTGMPDWKKPSGGESQPHIVQIGAILCNSETKEVIDILNVIIQPDGWEIPKDTIDVHGITEEIANDVGIPEKEAIKMLLDLRGDTDRVAFNKTFDQRIIRIGLKRFFNEQTQEKWCIKDDHHCAMLMSQKVMKGKYPKLIDAYKHFTGKEMKGAHDALADAKGCMTVYFAAKEALAKI